MTESNADVTTRIAQELPYLRRYARALTGSQTTGDNYAAATLEALLENQEVFTDARAPKVALFRAFHDIWVSSGAPARAADTAPLAESPQAKRTTSRPSTSRHARPFRQRSSAATRPT